MKGSSPPTQSGGSICPAGDPYALQLQRLREQQPCERIRRRTDHCSMAPEPRGLCAKQCFSCSPGSDPDTLLSRDGVTRLALYAWTKLSRVAKEEEAEYGCLAMPQISASEASAQTSRVSPAGGDLSIRY
ncbi:hypothetical protein Y1Q_0017319 [Alligator mississippiensis]|uniref:Uncharacterized protein n=1 Tax=Alligator mississippiensis TaxID=8496 RepID=A0A151MYL1_ALLMI|nr:hypothetical protein Y1Q_0017319 [Alligator mississippiensis]